MATWKKVIVSGSVADLSALSLDTALPVASGGTGAATLTDGGVLLGSGTGAVTALGQATNGQLVIGSTGADPVLATLTGGSNITVTNTAGAIEIAATGLGSGTVQSVSGNGTVNGITLSSDGDSVNPTLTLGGTLGSIENSQLTNDSVTIGTTEIDLGATAASLAGITSVTAATGSFTSGQFTGSFSGSFSGDVITNLEDLTAGNGLSGDAYDGNVARTFVVQADGSTLSVGGSGVKVADAGITATQIATSVAGAGLAGGGGTALSVNVDDSSIEIATDTLRVKSQGITAAMIASGSINQNHLASGIGLFSGSAQVNLGDASGTVTLGTQTTGDYVAALGSGTGVTIASNSGEGSNPTIAVDYGSTSNTAVQGNVGLTVQGTTNEIEVSGGGITLGAGGTATIGLPNSVTITSDLSVGQDLVVARNLTVQGTASFASTTDLDVADRFIRMASGSTATGDGGIVVQQTGPADGEAFAYDSAQTRWGVTGSYDPATNSITPDAFMSTVVIGSGGDAASGVVSKYQKAGNMFVSASGDIYIYS